MRYSPGMSENKRQLEILATDRVQQAGLSSVSFRTLAEQVGIKSSSVHYHFPEKGDLAAALIDRYAAEFFESLELIGKSRKGLRGKVTAFIGLFEIVASEGRLCLCGMMAAELAQLSDANQQRLADYFLGVEQWLVDLFDAHQTELNTSLSSQQLGRALLSSLEGALLLDRAVGSRDRLVAQRKMFLELLK